MEKISVIIINYNTPAVTKQAIQALLQNRANFDVEIILIDNGSKEKMIRDEWFREVVHIYIENDTNRGFAGAVNQGLEKATGGYIFLLNSDAFVNSSTLSGMVHFLKENKNYGIVGPKTVYTNGSFQISAGNFPSIFGEFLVATKLYKIINHPLFLMEKNFSKNSSSISVDWISGGCMMITKEVVDRIGIFDEHFFFGVEDMDYCYRAKKGGFSVEYLPLVEVTHLHSYSSGGTRSRFKLENESLGKGYFFRKHFPKKIVSRIMIAFLYWARIQLLDFSGKLK